MKTESSAGGVIACHVGNQWFFLLLKDMNGMWTFPKGIIENGERAEDAAAREIKEEVGVTGLKLLLPLPPIEYLYRRNGITKKSVQYFVFLSPIRRKPVVQREEGIREARWCSINDAMTMIGYRETNVQLLEETWKLVKRQISNG